MAEAVVLANGRIIKKSFFHEGLTLFNDSGTVRDFFYNNVYYSDFYFNKKFLFYGDHKWWLEYQRLNKSKPNPELFKGHFISESVNDIFKKYEADVNDKVTLTKRIIKTHSNGQKIICLEHYQWDFTSQIFYPNKNIIPPGNAKRSEDCNFISDDYKTFLNLNAGRVINSNGVNQVIDSKVVADIAQILSDFKKNDESFYGLLSVQGFLPVLQKQKEYLDLPTQQQLSDYYDKKWEYSTYTNEKYLKYRDFLLQYRAYYNSNKAAINALTDPEKMVFLANMFNSAELAHLHIDKKIKMLKTVAKGNLIGNWLFNDATEPIAVKLVNAVLNRDLNGQPNYADIDLFMDALQSSFDNKKSLYETLYEKIQDPVFFGDDGKGNRGQYVNAVYTLWLASKYNPYKKNKENEISTEVKYKYDKFLAPILLNYKSHTFLGLKFDSYSFKFSVDPKLEYNQIIEVKEGVIKTHTPTSHQDLGFTREEYVRGRYHMFQPISLMEQVNESLVNMPYISADYGDKTLTNFIPVFFLKYKDDVDGISNVKQTANLILDIALTFTGIGNVGKLRYLTYFRRARWGVPEFKTVLGAFEFTFGTLGTLSDYIGKDCNSNFCERLKNFVFWMEIATGSLDAITEVMVKKAAKNLKEATPASGLPSDLLENSAERTAFQNKIDQLADEAAEGVTSLFEVFLKTIDTNVNTKLQRVNKRRVPPDFEMIHTPDEIRSIVKKGEELNLSQKEIEDFIFVSCRKRPTDKTINATDLKQQMVNWPQIRKRGFPARFHSVAAFAEFSQRTKRLMAQFNIPSTDVYIQGSSLRKLDPMVADDIDIAVFMTREEYDSFVERQIILWRIREGKLPKESNRHLRDFIKSMQGAHDGGRVGPQYFKNANDQKINDVAEMIFEGNPTIFSGLADFPYPPNPNKNKFNLSIIIKNGDYDVSPYMKLK